MPNSFSGFRMTGLDRSAVLPANEFRNRRESLAQQKGLRFIPLYSPTRSQPHRSDMTNLVVFTREEVAHFESMYEEGYDVPDERYEKWLSMYHLDSPVCDHSIVHQSEDRSVYESPETLYKSFSI